MKKLVARACAVLALASTPALAGGNSTIVLRLVDTSVGGAGWTKCSRYFSYRFARSGEKFVLFTAQVAGIRQPLVAPTTRTIVFVTRAVVKPAAIAFVHMEQSLVTDGFALLLPWRDVVQARSCLPRAGRLPYF